MKDSPRIDSIFQTATEFESDQERLEYLAAACGDDADLRSRVEQLLKAHYDAGSFMDGPSSLAAAEDDWSSNRQIGPYKLLEQIGEGGMGVVYMAEQTEPVERRVALKVIKPGMDTRQVIARFAAEQQALAVMDHPNIARVFDAGATESGRPYFVMELVKGVPITEYCDMNRLSLRKRLELFLPVCQAVQHAHQKGIIHRDLKPTNVLIAEYDERPVAKVIDFGVAKAIGQRLTEKTMFTEFGQLVGTFEYMSPEQAKLNQLDVDTRTDVYSLGVLLYELLTGQTPLDRKSLREAALDEMLRIIREVEPLRPSLRLSTSDALPSIAANRQLNPQELSRVVGGDLDWIVMRALEKDRARRYETASSLAADVAHYLNDEPVSACPPSAAYRFRKFARRNRAVLLTIGLVMVTLAASSVVSAWQAIRATRALHAESIARQDALRAMELAGEQEDLAREQRDLTLRNVYTAQMRLAHQDWQFGNLARMINTLGAHRPENDLPDLRGWEWYYLTSLAHSQRDAYFPQLGPIFAVRFNLNGRLLAIAGHRGVKIYEPISQQEVLSLPEHAYVAWSPDGSRLATVRISSDSRIVRVLAVDDWQEVQSIDSNGPVTLLEWTPDARALTWCHGANRFSIWDLDQGGTDSFQSLVTEPLSTLAMSWKPDGRLLATGESFPPRILLWDLLERKPVKVIVVGGRGITNVAWHSDGKHLATASIDGDIALWDTESGERVQKVGAHRGYISTCDWSPDGRHLVSAGEDNLIRIWNVEAAQQLSALHGHRAFVYAVDWSPKEDVIVSGSQDGSVRFWRPFEIQDAVAIPGRQTAAWSPDGTRVVSNDPRGGDKISYSIRDSRTGQVVQPLQASDSGSMFVLAWSLNSKMIGGASMHNSAHVWEASTGRLIHSIDGIHSRTNGRLNEIRCFAWAPDGRHFATCGTDRLIKVWATSSGELLHTLTAHDAPVGSVCWSSNGRWLASTDWRRDIVVWLTDSWKEAWRIDQTPASFGGGAPGDYTIAWGPDSRRLASVNAIGDIAVWWLEENRPPRQLWSAQAHTSIIRSLCWSPDGSRIASGSEDRTAKIWDAETGQELLTLDGHEHMVTAVVWSPDGHRLASADDLSLRIWDATFAYEGQRSPASEDKEQ